MKNTILNTLGYTGTVTLSQYIGSKKIKTTKMHNTGGSPLFSFLSDCLIGDFGMAKATRPTKIMLLNYSEESNTITPVSGFIYLLTAPEKVYDDTATSSTVRYSFIISRELFGSAKETFNSMGLYTNAADESDYQNYAAFCRLSDIDINNLSPSSILVVDWELTISNNKTLKEVF